MLKFLVVAMVIALSILLYHEVSHDVLLAKKSVALRGSQSDAFRYVSEMKNYPKWFPGIGSFEPQESSPMRVGKHFTEIQTWPLYGDMVYDNVVVQYEVPHSLSFISDTWLMLRVDIKLLKRDDTKHPTTLTLRIYTRRRSYLVNYVVAPILELVYAQKIRQAMLNITFRVARTIR